LNVFNDTGTIKNEAPAADPSVCAANGLVCGAGWHRTIQAGVEPEVPRWRGQAGAILSSIFVGLGLVSWTWREVWRLGVEGSEEAGWSHGGKWGSRVEEGEEYGSSFIRCISSMILFGILDVLMKLRKKKFVLGRTMK
jgi:hypothetical protein